MLSRQKSWMSSSGKQKPKNRKLDRLRKGTKSKVEVMSGNEVRDS
jgi:hypothetical protein